MKNFIIVFVIGIFLIAFIVSECNEDINNEVTEEVAGKGRVIDQRQAKTIEVHKAIGSPVVYDSMAIEIPKVLIAVPEQILFRLGYTASYNGETKCPNWVAWHLTAERVDGNYKRMGGYQEDTSVPMPRATKEDYNNTRWSHGHMCPAADNKWDQKAMIESNLLTNICPQDQSLNSGLWNKIEQDCRRWAKKYGDVYIVCGPVLLNKEHETIGDNNIVVPEAFFKVILCLNPKPKSIGYIIRNNEGTKKRDHFINTVDEVERITGIDFFPALPDDVENEVESYANINDWK